MSGVACGKRAILLGRREVEPILKNEQEVREYLVRQLHAHLAKIDRTIFTFLKDSDTIRYLNVCPVCGTVFMRQRLGKPRKFCSVSCRAKGIPSAKKRAEYTRNQRRKAKERESSIAREILDKTHSAIDRINLLRQAFPRKSLQQCRNVLKRVERIEHPITEV